MGICKEVEGIVRVVEVILRWWWWGFVRRWRRCRGWGGDRDGMWDCKQVEGMSMVVEVTEMVAGICKEVEGYSEDGGGDGDGGVWGFVRRWRGL
ncbi:hypothetical protein FCV25MIE_11591 [Fagus crenata]